MNLPIEPKIIEVRGRKVILSGDLAALYEVETRVLNQQVRRNSERFPEDFCFQLTKAEMDALVADGSAALSGKARLRSQSVTLKRGQHSKYQPFAFTEHGAIMAATVLNSPQAIAMSVYVVRAFMQMREQIAANAQILKRLAEIDKTLLEHDSALVEIWQRLMPLLAPPPEPKRRRIGFVTEEE
jgi:hypothetical protein